MISTMDSPLTYQHLPRFKVNEFHVTVSFMSMEYQDHDLFNMIMRRATIKEDHHEDKSFSSSL